METRTPKSLGVTSICEFLARKATCLEQQANDLIALAGVHEKDGKQMRSSLVGARARLMMRDVMDIRHRAKKFETYGRKE